MLSGCYTSLKVGRGEVRAAGEEVRLKKEET